LTVHVGGNFIQAGGVTVESIADFSGGQWQALGGGVARVGCTDCAYLVNALARFGDPGQGPLYAAGAFDVAGGVAASQIARWTGSEWLATGAGVGPGPSSTFPAFVQALAVYGPALYAAGSFGTAGSAVTNSIARWDGQNWSDVGGGLQIEPTSRVPSINALAVFDDGRGLALYAAGIIDNAGGAAARNIARWDGASWSAVGGGVGNDVNDQVRALAVFDDGSGPALYAGGDFADAGGAPALNIARWNGSRWSALGSGVDGGVYAMEPFNDGTGPGLFVGGYFTSAGGIGSPNLAKWAGCVPCYVNCDRSTIPPVLNVLDFVCFTNAFVAGDPYANCDGSTTPPVLNVSDFICFQARFAAGCP
jgi:hypothetical protein